MEHLLDPGVAEKSAEIRRAVMRPPELHQMTVAVAGRELHEAQPVAMRMQAHRLGVDGDDGAEIDALGQIFLVQLDLHVTCIWSGPPCRARRPPRLGPALVGRGEGAVNTMVDGMVPRRGLEPPRPCDR